MFRKRSAPKGVLILALALLLATTALAAAQSPELHLPLITGSGEAAPEAPATPGEEQEAEPPLPIEPDPNAGEPAEKGSPPGDSHDTNSGDHEVDMPAETAAINSFNVTQWTVQNDLGVGTQTPTADIDLARNANDFTRLLVRNPHAGSIAQAQLYLNTVSANGLVVQLFGSGYAATWNGISLANRARLRTTPGVTGLILTTGGNYPLILGTADQQRMRITPDGLVGIGTTTPAHRLSIAGGPPWTINSWSGAVDLPNGSAIGWRTNNNGISFGMGQTYDGLHIFHTESAPGTTGSEAVYDLNINNNGNVGIGAPATNHDLFVNGSTWIDDGPLFVNRGDLLVNNGDIYVRSEQMQVPDYVFEPDYPLMSLDELRVYVAAEKHLPNVPDAEQIAQGGLNVSEFQMKLLEKTEELTLYALAQDEQLQTQQQEIETLQQENQTMQQENQAKDGQLAAMQQMIAGLETRLSALEEQE